MKNKSILVMLLILMVFLAGCTAHEQNLSATETAIPTAAPTESAATEPPTEAPTEPTYPENYLGIEAGSYQKKYSCSATGDYLDYYLHIPENAVSGMPLIIFLHGDGEADKIYKLENFGMVASAREIYGEEFPFISIAPCTRVKSWIDNEIPETLMALIEYIVVTYEIDKEHIIITGHSRGAIGVWEMISVYGDYFSAAVPVSSPNAANHIYFANCAKVPVWTFAGDVGDHEVWYHQYLEYNVNQINYLDGSAQFTILKGADHAATKTKAFSEETFEWMLSQ